jgi:hypothetical protein
MPAVTYRREPDRPPDKGGVFHRTAGALLDHG